MAEAAIRRADLKVGPYDRLKVGPYDHLKVGPYHRRT